MYIQKDNSEPSLCWVFFNNCSIENFISIGQTLYGIIILEGDKMFIDQSVITVIAGNGGNGAATFRREKAIQFGGPDGGDGGHGGSIIFVADSNINTLVDFRFNKRFKAQNGENGAKKRMYGKRGEDLIIKVPIGTMVRDFETNALLMDVNVEGEARILLKGGNGGHGNVHFKSSKNRTPRVAAKGREGVELKVKLELKLLADVALVGYPNVGKSSLITKVSASKSKIGNYHFTTLNPKLGVVRVGDEESYVIADIPGLVEGAHDGVGLGDQFLRHIERCKMIYHIVDISASEGRSAIEDFEKINHELKNYSEKLAAKKQVVLANKMDMLYDENGYDEFEAYLKKKGIKAYPVSVLLGEGLDDIKYDTYEMLQGIEREVLEEEIDVVQMVEERNYKADWIITRGEDGEYIVDGRLLDETFESYVFNNDEAIRSFLHILYKKGLEKVLRQEGVESGDTVVIDELEFEFVD